MKINIVDKTGIEKIADAVIYLEQNIDRVLSEIENLSEKHYFTYTEKTNVEVVKQLRNYFDSDASVTIRTYRSRWPWSKVIGYSKGNRIVINRRKLRSYDSKFYAGHLTHELCHKADFSHGNNYITEKKKYSVPYFMGYLMNGKRNLSDLVESPYYA